MPGNALTASGPFVVTDALWTRVTEHEECGPNHVSTILSPTIDEPTAVAFAYRVGDGTIWLSTENTLHFTLFADEDGYWIGMEDACAEELPPNVQPSEREGDSEPRPYTPLPPTLRLGKNYVLIFVGTHQPPPSSVPESGTLGLVSGGLMALWSRRRSRLGKH